MDELIIKQELGKLRSELDALKSKFSQQMTYLHYRKKEQIELTSIWNNANKLIMLEIELGQNKNYWNEDGTINFNFYRQRLNEICDFYLKDFITREQSYKSDYFQIRDEVKQEQTKNEPESN